MRDDDSDAATDGGIQLAPTASDDRADYDYVGGAVEHPSLVSDLEARVDGEVRFDTYTRQLYATDASAYEVTPIGVVFPTSTDDVASVVSYCAEREIPVLPRGGGTSLAGQTVNEAVVLDFTRHMSAVVSLDADGREARVQAGTVLADLNDRAAEHDLTFGPDPAAGNRSAIGGAIGNNSTGAHSLVYEKTDHYIEECEVVLADGTVTTFGEVTVESLRERADPDSDDLEARVTAGVLSLLENHAGEIDDRYPELKRNVSGYNLDRLVAEYEGEYGEAGTVNLARLLAGSEGTLAIVTEATVSLESVPETKSVALLTYDSVVEAVSDVQHVLNHDPAAVELIDDVLIDLASDTKEFADVAAKLPDRTRAALLVEFYADNDDHGREQVARLLTDRVPDSQEENPDKDHFAFDALEAHDDSERKEIWKLRKSGLPILLGRTSDEKHISFLEDCAIPPEHLPEFVSEFQNILDENDTFASFYAHAGPGVLHVRPLVNTKSQTDLDAMENIGEAVTDLVVEFGGSVSGEHGDGRARTQWNRKLYGERLWEAFRDLKTAFDPDWLLNPGQVCGDVSLTENLRFDPDYEFDAGFDSALEWDNENGMQGMVELCHGCGGCRTQQSEGGVMCPTFRAADEEVTSTRGRANMLRQAMSGDLPDDPTDDEFVTEVMDLCIGCKGCAHDCPSEVDMAKLKVEVEHAHHQEHGAGLRERVFANVDTLAQIGSALAPLSNLGPKLPGARAVMEKTLGIARERSLPTFERESLQDWFAARGPQVPESEATRKAVLFPDTYTNFSHPEIGKATVRVLEAANVHVAVADVTDSGRPSYSKGFIDATRETAREAVDALTPRVADGWDIVVVEPSDAVMLQSDYLDLLTGEDVSALAANCYGVCEYLDTFRLDDDLTASAPDRSLAYHGHCHQKATKKDHHAVGVLRRAGYDVDPLDSGCCGMAGSFGYESEHHAMSMAIGETLEGQVTESKAEAVVAPGASCRTQLADLAVNTDGAFAGSNREGPPTPIEALDAAIDNRNR
ncbi:MULTISPECIES: FAD-binding and (Fe-S)-binding domain-containing protein [Halorubrum]|uniref:D-lactate dehydrogenase (cytochrome) n=1 Tax=Halorubrum tropicale TaxID=1765655 RepID=A0A0M9AN56_9EURY|nr:MULTISPECIES: FAD-binding and (Fe-S)-binding domain-containing protein [Halorubrum]KOX95437.1 FAD-dependent oxidoreductase [Halorubrum tropicale]MDB2239010.1 FAD-linked oxidase C-terminal domain-containing protein [Halorubrum ezzemoulense]MDB2249747.1 FAD-linked oxidase C-terminal domain-containing protein [Halorubrum ezzemoulense]